MPAHPKKRSLVVSGHRTSVSLEDDFWSALQEMARERGNSLPALISEIDAKRGNRGLSGAVRSAVLAHYRTRAKNT